MIRLRNHQKLKNNQKLNNCANNKFRFNSQVGIANLKLFIRKLALFYKTVTNIADSDIKCQSKINRAVFSISDVKKYVAY